MNAENSSQIVIQQVITPGRRLIWNSLVIQHVIHPKHTTNRNKPGWKNNETLSGTDQPEPGLQCGIISAESGINCSQHPESILREAAELFLKTRWSNYKSRLCWRIRVVLVPDIDGQACTVTVMSIHVSLLHLFPCFQQNLNNDGAQDLCTVL